MSTTCLEKVFNDPIHGHIELHPLMVKIIDTPQFQRLRNLKQLGAAYYVFMGASHNRFEHSVGVGYLAGELVETLHRKQPELRITSEDILCVKIAGLCHDLGHGPFSHMFDGLFIPMINPDSTWKHEDGSVMMFDHLIKENHLEEEFSTWKLTDQDIIFIKELIGSQKLTSSDWPYKGRTKEKSFLYEIVANKRTGIDVDKWDYFARDCHCLGIPNSFDMRRCMQFARVISVNSMLQICTRDKEVVNLYEMFHTRMCLHRRAYQHKTTKILEYMITEALVIANDCLLLPGKNGSTIKMSEAIEDPYAYTLLTDYVVQSIMVSQDPRLSKAKDLLQRVQERKLYKFIGQAQQTEATSKKPKVIIQEILSYMQSDYPDEAVLTENDLIAQIVTYDYGMKSEDPIKYMRFYTKNNPNKAERVTREQVSQMLPTKFKEQVLRVYCKSPDKQKIDAAKRYFNLWCQEYASVTPTKDDSYESEDADTSTNTSSYVTPVKHMTDSPTLDPPSKKRKLFQQ